MKTRKIICCVGALIIALGITTGCGESNNEQKDNKIAADSKDIGEAVKEPAEKSNGSVNNISLGYDNSAAVTKDGVLYVWGNNYYGQLGNGKSGTGENDDDLFSSVPVKIMDTVKAVSIGGDHCAAVTEDGSLYMWGSNTDGKLGNGTDEDILTPVKIMDNVKEVSLGDDHSGAVTNDGELYMW